ncbi:MAG: hypothetical protein ACMXX8_00080 [Candidatus Woesearchaeota archaeon]
MVDIELIKKYGFEEENWDLEDRTFGFTGFPKPIKRYRIVAEDFNMSIEGRYYWVLNYLREEQGIAYVEKITDIFSAAENSSFFGASQQRLGIQQDKVSSFLATIGKMIKEIFQLVRELRILDERLSYYKDSYDFNSKSRESAEITLKGIWIDMVEQGSKNPASVYGMARELGFSTLPDLFFATHPIKKSDVDLVVNKLDFNKKLKEVLKRKLRSFLEWKESTFSELKTKRKFTLKYLRQHYDIIKMYMEWVKPYLKNIRKLHMSREKMDSPEIISAFETSFIEIETLFKKKHGSVYACLLAHFDCRTMPAMNFNQEYNKGPLHVGRVDLVLRGYVWTEKQIEKYKEMKKEEDFRLLSHVDQSVKQAMDSMGTELAMYLVEAGETEIKGIAKQNKSVTKIPNASVIKGFGELFGSLKKSNDKGNFLDIEKAESSIKKLLWDCYKDYKKSHGHIAW